MRTLTERQLNEVGMGIEAVIGIVVWFLMRP
jgi:hypothetical protein